VRDKEVDMTHGIGRRSLITAAAVIGMLGFAVTPAAVADPGHSGDAPFRGRIVSMLQHMSVEEKVGQLFVVEVYGARRHDRE
jgi:beta-N-acetylhexosaminidase